LEAAVLVAVQDRCMVAGRRMETASQTASIEDAFADAVRLYGPGAYRLALRLTDDPQRAEDAVADALAKVWVQFRRGRVDAVGPYLRRAVVNQVTSSFRRRAVERRWLERRSGDDRGERELDAQAADEELFRAALAQLPERQRAAVVLRYWEDASEREIAEALGCTAGTVKRHLHRGVGRLRQLLTDADRELDGV
jgi:RNA polymerase sigma-70 factor (sigma-E family)